MKWKPWGIVILLLGLTCVLIFRTILSERRSERYFHQTHEGIRIGMGIREMPIFGPNGPNQSRWGFVVCNQSGANELKLRRDDWHKKSQDGFPPACRTMRIFILGESYLGKKAVFDLEFDPGWNVAKIGALIVLPD